MKQLNITAAMSVVVETRVVDISRDHKNSYFFEMADDLSATNAGVGRVSPTVPPSAHSRKSSTGDSAFYEDEAAEDSELCRVSEAEY